MTIAKSSYNPERFSSPKDNAMYLTLERYAGKKRSLDAFRYFKRKLKQWDVYPNVPFPKFRQIFLSLEQPGKRERLVKKQLEIVLK